MPFFSLFPFGQDEGGHCPKNQGNQGKSVEFREGGKGLEYVREKSGNLIKKTKIGEKSGNLNRWSKRKSFTIPWFQSDGLIFYQNAISRSQGNFSEEKEKSVLMKETCTTSEINVGFTDNLLLLNVEPNI